MKKTGNMRKTAILAAGGVLILLLGTGAFVWHDYVKAASGFEEGALMELNMEAGDGILVSWTEASSAEGYQVQAWPLSDGTSGEDTPLFSLDTEQTQAVLEAVPKEGVTVSVAPFSTYWTPMGRKIREGSGALFGEADAKALEACEVRAFTDREAQTLTVQFEAGTGEGLSYELIPEESRISDEAASGEPGPEASEELPEEKMEEEVSGAESSEEAPAMETGAEAPGAGIFEEERTESTMEAGRSGGQEELLLHFGEDGDYPVPEYGAPLSFVLRPVIRGENYVAVGECSEPIVVERDDVLPESPLLEWEALGGNRFRFFWTEAAGNAYELQSRTEDGNWETVDTFSLEDEREYQTGVLPSARSYSYRVSMADEQGNFLAASGETAFRTEISSLYCTIWPVRELPVYASADMSGETVGTVSAGNAYCVLGEENGMFLVRTDGNILAGSSLEDGVQGYIDSRYCMINLPEYLGDLCDYDITNSYASRCMMHGYSIPEVTGTVIPGYEKVRLADGNFLAPYLYPSSQKLIAAVETAAEDGYRFRIYDAYRPHEATAAMYERTSRILDEPLPVLDGDGGNGEFADGSAAGPENAEGIPAASSDLAQGTKEPTASEKPVQEAAGEFAADAGDGQGTGTEAVRIPVYRDLVDHGPYTLASFLARKGSSHNMGIALDLTLLTSEGEELPMQSDMHDLSWYSVTPENTEAANLLSQYMTEAGFHTLLSEWWHFQDNETRDTLGLEYLEEGVSVEGWKAGNEGWRYRNEDGSWE